MITKCSICLLERGDHTAWCGNRRKSKKPPPPRRKTMSEEDKQAGQPDSANWPKNIVAQRHEVTGKWVMWYLTDEQAAKCKVALALNEG